MIAVADLTAEDASATFPNDWHAGAPNRSELGGTRGRHVALVSLAGLARLAARQSRPTRQCLTPALLASTGSSEPAVPEAQIEDQDQQQGRQCRSRLGGRTGG